MIDFLVKEDISDKDANLLLQHVFKLAEKDILVYSYECLESMKTTGSYECLAMKSSIEGDAKTLLQLSGIEIPLATFLGRLQSYCKKKLVTCYVTSDNVYPNSYYNYYKITPDYEMIEVSEWLKYDDDNEQQIYFYDTPLKN